MDCRLEPKTEVRELTTVELLVSGSGAGFDEKHRGTLRRLLHGRAAMTPIASHVTAFLRQRLPVERGASENTCESYAYAFRLLFEYADKYLRVAPSQLHLEQLDAPLIVDFLDHLETTRGKGAYPVCSE
jgi:hypothetical protein